jgi:hypothetical protein
MKPIYKLLHWIPNHKLNIYELSNNPRAKEFLEENIEKISYNFETINLLEQNIDRLEWSIINDWIILPENIILLPENTQIQLLEKNVDKINWKMESRNPDIFELDYNKMSILRTQIIFQELMAKTWNRNRLCQCINIHDEIDIL